MLQFDEPTTMTGCWVCKLSPVSFRLRHLPWSRASHLLQSKVKAASGSHRRIKVEDNASSTARPTSISWSLSNTSWARDIISPRALLQCQGSEYEQFHCSLEGSHGSDRGRTAP